jgi:hypothetical protein
VSAFWREELRDLAKVEEAAHSILRQCEYLRRNGPDDRIRWGLIATQAWWGWRAAARADRRATRVYGWFPLRWRLPRGYDA